MAGEKSTAFANSMLLAYYNNTADGSLLAVGAATQLFFALHTADPTAAGTQNSNEASYTGYARVGVNRNSGGFTVTTNAVALTAAIAFGNNAGSAQTLTWWSVGIASSGTTKFLHAGPLSGNLGAAGVAPGLAAGTIITEV